MDIRLFVLNGQLKISIRDNRRAMNHLLFEQVDEFDGIGIRIVRGMAKKVDYSFMTGFNVLNVEI